MEPNDFVLSSFFSAVSFAACSRSQLDSTFAILAEARARGPLNDTVYTANFMLLTRQGIPERAVDVWRAAQQDGAPMTPHLFSALFAACTAGNSPPLVDVAVDAYNDLREWWGAQDKSRVAAWLERDVLCAYNSLLHFVGQSGNLDEALGVFEDMKREGPLPDAVTYNTVIAAAAHVGDVDTALNVFLEMTNVGAAPTERTFGALLHAFAVVGDANAARKVFESVEAAGVKLNAVLYTSFIDALVKSGDDAALAQAFEVMEDMRRRRVPATAVTYGCLLSACEKLGNVDLAFKLYERACAEGVAPSDEMHDILISVCTAGGRLDEALDLVKSLARTHSTLQQGTLNSLVRALCSTAPSRALRMLSLMQTMGMQPTRRTYLALVTACAGSGEVLEAQALYRSMKAQGMEMDSAAGSALIACLCQAQKLSQAVAVYDEMMGAAWREEPAAPPTRKIPRKAALPKRAQVPDASALAFLAQAHAASGDLKSAWRFYKQLQRLGTGLQETVLTHRRLFEGLIEGFCRQKKVGRALIVFDDWKTASSAWFVQQSKLAAAEAKDAEGGAQGASAAGPPAPAGARLGRYPKLSNVSLAFLEACCRSEPDIEEWRIYDVCSVMRMQKDRKVQAGLARPQKASHHFLGNVQSN